jgi:uncharacterized membrane protein
MRSEEGFFMASSSPLYRSEYEPRGFAGYSSSDRFWPGFATGALIGAATAVAGYMIAGAVRGSRDRRVVRFETSIQIGRNVSEVFNAWSNFDRLPELLDVVRDAHSSGNTSHWRVKIDGKEFEWQAETTQFIPNESIGWKSVSGPKHTGRVTFSSIGNDTLMHVTVNYAPPLGRFGSLFSPVSEHIEGYINDALRDFKAAVEAGNANRGRAPQAEWRERSDRKATGTYGLTGTAENPSKVDYTRPPEARYPISNPNPKITRD